MLNVVATLWHRLGNVGQRRCTSSKTDVATTLIFNRVRTLWQRQPRRCKNVVTASLCQLGCSASTTEIQEQCVKPLVF